MARGLTVWVQVLAGGVTGPLGVVHCTRKAVRPREAEMVATWTKGVLNSPNGLPRRLLAKEATRLEGIAGWRVEKGIKIFQGLWWIWNPSLKVGALVGDNTPPDRMRQVARELLRKRAALRYH